MSDRPDGITLATITVDLILTEQPGEMSELVYVDTTGDPTLMVALGMLRMAEDTLLHGPDEEADDA